MIFTYLKWQHNGRLELAHVDFNDMETLSKECDILSPNALGNVSVISLLQYMF